MDNRLTTPLVHLYENTDARNDILFLVSYLDGTKKKINYEELKSKLLEGVALKTDIPDIVSIDVVVELDNNNVMFKGIPYIAAHPSIEQAELKEGSIYFNGVNVRVKTNSGWKSLTYKNEG